MQTPVHVLQCLIRQIISFLRSFPIIVTAGDVWKQLTRMTPFQFSDQLGRKGFLPHRSRPATPATLAEPPSRLKQVIVLILTPAFRALTQECARCWPCPVHSHRSAGVCTFEGEKLSLRRLRPSAR
jgi:hypothetical protein